MIDKLKKSGVDISKFMIKIKLLEILPDIIDMLSEEVKQDLLQAGLYKHDTKRDLKKVQNTARTYVKNFDRKIGSKSASEEYGEISDSLLEVLKDKMKDYEENTK